ncbi:NACHT domain-containing protein [Nocardioides sp. CN2-186]|uniref:NACHT domain-containing protein n=1 Tax=Nocardioides tweenelious TaxID=3156607 RepID=UPI0032B62728
MLDAVFAELAAAATLRLARQVETAARRRRDRAAVEERRAAAFLGELDLDRSALRANFSVPPTVKASELEAFLRSSEAQAVAFELLTVVLAGDQEIALPRVQARWNRAISARLPNQEQLAREIFETLVSHFEIASGVVRDVYPKAFERLVEDNHHRRIACVLEAIETRLDPASAGTPKQADIDRFKATYRRQVKAAHKYITPPDFDRRRDVPIDDLYVTPSIRTASSKATADGDQVDDVLSAIDRTVLLGDPGNGKSTAAHVMLFRMAKIPHLPLPFLVVLREFAGAGVDKSIVSYLEDRLASVYQCPPPQGMIEHLLDTGQAIVFFDGLDELLDTTHRRQVTDVVGLFCNRYPLTKALVTSRKVGYWQAPMDRDQFAVLELSGFDREQVEEYVEKWFSQEDLSSDQVTSWTRSFMTESESVADLTATPLLLALMCIIYRGERSIPRNRPAVYERCATMLFDKWDSSRGIHSDLRVGQLVDPAMKHLAYWLFVQDSSDGVTEQSLIKETTTYLHRRSFEDLEEATAAATEFVEFCRGRAWVFSDVGTTPDGERLYKFTHRTFLEYFAGYHLSRTTDTPEALAKAIAPKVANAEWDVVAQLAVQITDKHSDLGAIRIFEYLLDERRRRASSKRLNILAFLCRCLTFVQLSPKVLRQLTSEVFLKATQRWDDSTVAHSAVETLALLLANSTYVDRKVVEDELRTQIEVGIASADPWTKRATISVITSSSFLFYFASGSATLSPQTREFWSEWFNEVARAHRSAITETVGIDTETTRYALRAGWVTVAEVLRRADRGLDPLFDQAPTAVGRILFMSLASEVIRIATRTSAEASQMSPLYGECLDSVYQYVLARGSSTAGLVTRMRPSVHPFRSEQNPDESYVVLSDQQTVGLAVMCACAVEENPDLLAHWEDEDWGPRDSVRQLLCVRAGLQDARPKLPLEGDPVTESLLRWSSNELHYSTRRMTSGTARRSVVASTS